MTDPDTPEGPWVQEVHLLNGSAWHIREAVRRHFPAGPERDHTLAVLGYPIPWNERCKQRNAELGRDDLPWAVQRDVPLGPDCGVALSNHTDPQIAVIADQPGPRNGFQMNPDCFMAWTENGWQREEGDFAAWRATEPRA